MKSKSEMIKKGEISLNKIFANDSIEKTAELYPELKRGIMTGADLGISLPLLANWVKQLDDKVTRRKYSFTDYIWYKLVEQLRNAGLNFNSIRTLNDQLVKDIEIKGVLTKIQQAKEYIEGLKLKPEQKIHLEKILGTNKSNISSQTKFSILQILIIECVLTNQPQNIAVFIDGSYTIINTASEHFLNEDEKNKLIYETYISVSLNTILKRLLYSDIAYFVINEIGLYSPEVNKLFNILYTGTYDLAMVKLKDRNENIIEIKKTGHTQKRLVDYILNEEFETITVKYRNEVLVKIDRVKKIVL